MRAFPSDFPVSTIHGWRGVRLDSGDISIGLTPDIGGRIMSLMFQGEELFYSHRPEQGNTFDLTGIPDILAFKKEFGFRIFGGDKTWVAPEREWLFRSPPVDLDASRYSLGEKDGVFVMTSPVCRETGARIIRRLRIEKDGDIHLEEEIENTTDRPLLKGVWNVAQLRRPFDVYLPADPAVIRSYYLEDPTLPDPGQQVDHDGEWAKISCRTSTLFKFGGIPERGQVFVVRPLQKGLIVFARRFDLDRNADYAHRSAVEVFNSSLFDYGEVEIHAPFQAIPPLGRSALRQVWRLRGFPAGVSPLEAVRRVAESF